MAANMGMRVLNAPHAVPALRRAQRWRTWKQTVQVHRLRLATTASCNAAAAPRFVFDQPSNTKSTTGIVPKPTLADRAQEYWRRRKDPELEEAARRLDLRVPLTNVATLSDQHFLAYNGHLRLRNMAFNYHIFDDVFGKVFVPKKNFAVSWADTYTYRGNLVAPNDTLVAPAFHFEPEANVQYTVALLDADGRLDGSEGQVAHALTCNLTGPTASGDEVLPYMPLTPFQGSGYHRVVAVLLQQSGALDAAALRDSLPAVSSQNPLSNRYMKLQDWARQHNLQPVAFSFSQAQHDASVTSTLASAGFHQEPSFA
ncbi:uncharacterized protein MONBRDRAFT_26154 [Monosiga brevicollis MX1]|uniref:Uncharacterized protein n=1 Tax=Monosiga brevicollis TaxID=81824 RepID=A9V1I6_MONBE|nr:uncharacterized protein MONBRDRAFT_26154 [Monosiga brevicollis MX1]EDQ88447.1 predicted protein [Monosiga brevicollis MX1]|eukprot:XP_001746551.1 hypothetical protein [Monosiga brevicollis MX1]